ncbi:MAG: TonB-dependent receptor plug domain-containing protein, partial [Selenomonas sp.]
MGKQRRNWLALAIVGALTGMSLHGSVQAAEADGEETAHELSETVVEAGRAKLAGGLVERRENIGLLGSKDVMETPFQAMTFGKKALDQFSVPDRTILDTLSLSPAVRVGKGATDSNVTIRGLSSNGNKWYINGVPGMAHQKDMTANFIDSVTVIAGPALGVRGTTAGWQENAGGVVDMISKKASAKGDREAKISFHGKSYVSQSVDLGERFGENKEWGVRFNVLQGQGTLSVDHARMWKWGVYLNLDHKTANSTTNLLMGYDYTRQRGDGNSLSVAKNLKSLPKAPRGSINFSPDWAEDTYNDWTFILNHEQKLSEHAKAFLNAGYHKENYTSWIQGYGRTLLNMNGDYASRASSGWGSGYSQWPVAHSTKYIGIGVKGDFKLGEWKSDYVLSLDKMWFRREVIGNYGSDPSDVYIPAPGNIYRSNSTPLNARFPKHTLK